MAVTKSGNQYAHANIEGTKGNIKAGGALAFNVQYGLCDRISNMLTNGTPYQLELGDRGHRAATIQDHSKCALFFVSISVKGLYSSSNNIITVHFVSRCRLNRDDLTTNYFFFLFIS